MITWRPCSKAAPQKVGQQCKVSKAKRDVENCIPAFFHIYTYRPKCFLADTSETEQLKENVIHPKSSKVGILKTKPHKTKK